MRKQNKSSAFVEDLLRPVGIPLAYRRFYPTKSSPAPAPPYMVYYLSQERAEGADDGVLLVHRHVVLELYSERPDGDLESRIEAALCRIDWTKDEEEIEAEAVNLITYEFEIIEKRRTENEQKR